jgi:hypothetical protein
MHGLDVHQHSL